jgi:hypothetical protein
VHPIERLRYLSRAGELDVADPSAAVEAAWAIAELALSDPPAAFTAARRLVARTAGSPQLLWACSAVLAGGDPVAGAEEVSEELGSRDTTAPLVASLDERLAPPGPLVAVVPAPTLVGARRALAAYDLSLVGERASLSSALRSFGSIGAVAFEASEASALLASAAVLIVEPRLSSPAGYLLEPCASSAVAAAQLAAVSIWVVITPGSVLTSDLAESFRDSRDEELSLVPADVATLVIDGRGTCEATVALKRSCCPGCLGLLPASPHGKAP